MNNAPISYLLLADGTSDRALLPIIKWSLRRALPSGEFKEPEFIKRDTSISLATSIDTVAAAYLPDIIFVHRDAENKSHQDRLAEFPSKSNCIPVIPVRMSEAWLLIDERAVRRAANNPNGKAALEMPKAKEIEKIVSPKKMLHTLILTATELPTRRQEKFNTDSAVFRLANLIEDFTPLTALPAFAEFEKRLSTCITNMELSETVLSSDQN